MSLRPMSLRRTSLRRKISALLVMALLAVTGVFLSAGTANAAYGCSGSLIDSRTISDSGHHWGTVDIYYNSGTGENCVALVHVGSYYGKRFRTSVALEVGSTVKSDTGDYAYYAGPVYLAARGKCIVVDAYGSPPGLHSVDHMFGPFHCG